MFVLSTAYIYVYTIYTHNQTARNFMETISSYIIKFSLCKYNKYVRLLVGTSIKYN